MSQDRGNQSRKPKKKQRLVDEDSIKMLASVVAGLRLEILELNTRIVNYERGVRILERVRTKLHQQGILTTEDMDGLEEEFQGIPMEIRRREAKEANFIAPLPALEHK